MPSHGRSDEPAHKATKFNRTAWREGLEELDPATRAAMAATSAEKERPDLLDIDRMVAGLRAAQEVERERE